MYYGGVDIGSAYLKCVVLNDKEIVAKSLYPVEGNPQLISKIAVEETLAPVKIKPKKIEKFVITGRNRKKFPFKNEEMTEILCNAKGAHDLIPSVRTILDIGAITNKAIKINAKGKVMEYVINDKCASGSGMFLELVARALEMDIAELGEKAGLSDNPLSVTNQCSIFAESEVIYLVNEGRNEIDIAAGVCNSIGGQLFSLLKRIRLEKDVVLAGGVANNQQITRNIEKRLEFPLQTLPINPSYVSAYGAALFAGEL